MTRTCHNPKCSKPVRTQLAKFCSVQCRDANIRNRRRQRRNRQRGLETLHAENLAVRYQCIDCDIVITPGELGEHEDDDHLCVPHETLHRCRSCGKPAPDPADPYCDGTCFTAYHYRAIPNLPPGMSAQDIVYSEQYSLLHGLTGFVEHAEDSDAFANGLHVVSTTANAEDAETMFVT